MQAPGALTPTLKRKRVEKHQTGHVYEASGSFYVRFYRTEFVNGAPKRVQKSHRLCSKDAKHYSADCKLVKILRDDYMRGTNAQRPSAEAEMTVADYWEHVYLTYAEKNLRPSTLTGYKGLWRQHLHAHFGDTLLREYSTSTASRFLTALAAKYRRRLLSHIRSCASAVFTHATRLGYTTRTPGAARGLWAR